MCVCVFVAIPETFGMSRKAADGYKNPALSDPEQNALVSQTMEFQTMA